MKKTTQAKVRASARRRQQITRLKNHPFIVPVTTFIVLFFITAIGLVALNGKSVTASDSHNVIIAHDGKRQTIPTRASTVGDMLSRLKINLNEGDVVEPAQDTLIQEDNFRVNVYRAQPVTIFDGDKRIQALSAATTARSITAQAGLSVSPEDSVVVSSSESILKESVLGKKLVINRAVSVRLNVYGTEVAIKTQAKTITALLNERNIKLVDGDSVYPEGSKVLSPELQVFVLRKGTQIQTAESTIETPIQTVEDRSLSYGTKVVRQKGSPGKKLVTFILSSSGQRQTIQEIIIENAVPQIVAKGTFIDISGDRTSIMAAAGISTDQFAAVNYIISRESNWRPNARNAGGCLGLGQRCPGSTLINACPNWEFDAVCQLKHFSAYANSVRFNAYGGGWLGAYAYWQSHGYW